MSKTLQRNLKSKIPISFLQDSKWDSSDEDDNDLTLKKDGANNSRNKPNLNKNKSKSTEKKSKTLIKYDGKKSNRDDSNNDDDETDLVLYIGHLPKQFEEIDLRRFLAQFGKVYNCRVARKIETGQPKGFAFAKFEDNEVTQIACDTLHGYFLEKQRLVCQVRPSHPGMFFDTDKMIDLRHKKMQLETKQRSRNLANSEKLKAITSRLVIRELKKKERLKALGIDYDFPGYTSNRTDFEEHISPEEDIDTAKVDEEDEMHAPQSKKKMKSNDNDESSKGQVNTKQKKDATNSKKTPEKKKKRKLSADQDEGNDSTDHDERLSKSAKKAKKKKKDTKKKNRRTSAP